MPGTAPDAPEQRLIAESVADEIVAEARRAIADERFGDFTNPFVLGLLTAAQMVRQEDSW